MKMTVACPHCRAYETVLGQAGERVILICPHCKKEGLVVFPKQTPVQLTNRKKGISITKKQAFACFLGFIFIISILAVIVIPSLQGNLHFLTVLSGSMEPHIHVGDVVVSSETDPKTIQTGDIITFRYDTEYDPDKCITHRVAEVIEGEYGLQFRTKGDANEENDIRPVKGSEVIGKVVLVLPYAGHLAKFARSIWGFFLFIALPALLIIANEIRILYSGVHKEKIKKL